MYLADFLYSFAANFRRRAPRSRRQLFRYSSQFSRFTGGGFRANHSAVNSNFLPARARTVATAAVYLSLGAQEQEHDGKRGIAITIQSLAMSTSG